MKRLIIAAMLTASAAVAEPATDDQKLELCEMIGKTAGAVMMQRQEGTPMSTLYKITANFDFSAFPPLEPVAKNMVTYAFDEPRYHTDSSKVRAQEDFREKFEVVCIQAFLED